MPRSTILSAMCLALLSGPSQGQDATKLPTGPAPSIFAVASVDRSAGTYTVNRTVRVQVPVLTEKTVIVMGMEKKVAVTSYRLEYRTVKEARTLKGLEFYNVKGEKLKEDEAAKRFIGGAVVLLSADGHKVDPAYLRIVKDDTLIVVIPAPATGK